MPKAVCPIGQTGDILIGLHKIDGLCSRKICDADYRLSRQRGRNDAGGGVAEGMAYLVEIRGEAGSRKGSAGAELKTTVDSSDDWRFPLAISA